MVEDRGGLVFDDHTAFLDQGIPVVLLIDFKYQWFHTMADTPDKCSPESLGQVGRAVMEALRSPVKPGDQQVHGGPPLQKRRKVV